MTRSSSLLRGALLFAAGALLSGAIAVAATSGGSNEIRQTSRSGGTPIYGIDPTGVGLPLVGAHSTTGAGDYATPLKAYNDSGGYRRDLSAVGSRAGAYLLKRLRALAAAKRRCLAGARRQGRSPQRCRQPKPAITLDIDETSLSNYPYLATANFENIGAPLALAAITANSPAIRPTLRLFNLAKRKAVAPFFITGRPTALEPQTSSNLRSAGYSGWRGLILNPGGQTTIAYKSGARAKLERRGFRIIVNVGDQESDLAGGHAERAFKLPNPFYFIP